MPFVSLLRESLLTGFFCSGFVGSCETEQLTLVPVGVRIQPVPLRLRRAVAAGGVSWLPSVSSCGTLSVQCTAWLLLAGLCSQWVWQVSRNVKEVLELLPAADQHTKPFHTQRLHSYSPVSEFTQLASAISKCARAELASGTVFFAGSSWVICRCQEQNIPVSGLVHLSFFNVMNDASFQQAAVGTF